MTLQTKNKKTKFGKNNKKKADGTQFIFDYKNTCFKLIFKIKKIYIFKIIFQVLKD